ncbi:hypothetical protein [Xanthobacter tagetidis]|jgi:hypothetical protein|uniref:PepSY domain-containing protein n=1 Tax=Xanthobacter tagetidis TaxID=60216 RepID=A0A3L7ANA0_9HYPH|nr:hypothetical protein [Xanthobacter tagetidis]MBB6308329.1 hypothetical protein [Xanthobacter tagetidis]RLP81929.1 hypothetical protein D9R14_02795 [Xanthobacter tagetidis]
MVRAGHLIGAVMVVASFAGGSDTSAQPPGPALASMRDVAPIHQVVDLTPPEPFRPYMRHPEGIHPVAPDQVADSLMRRGFKDVSVVRQRGGAYICEATGPRGERVRLVVDAQSGEISGMQVIGYKGK